MFSNLKFLAVGFFALGLVGMMGAAHADGEVYEWNGKRALIKNFDPSWSSEEYFLKPEDIGRGAFLLNNGGTQNSPIRILLAKWMQDHNIKVVENINDADIAVNVTWMPMPLDIGNIPLFVTGDVSLSNIKAADLNWVSKRESGILVSFYKHPYIGENLFGQRIVKAKDKIISNLVYLNVYAEKIEGSDDEAPAARATLQHVLNVYLKNIANLPAKPADAVPAVVVPQPVQAASAPVAVAP